MPLQSPEQDILLYEPLLTSTRQFRLLLLEPYRNPKEAIRCNLVTTSLDSDPKYEALSYTWGEPVDDCEIIVNSVTLAVRRNLWQALYHLRGAESRTLWIDALCINQKNIPERNEQVQMMRQIYERAQRVVIWLGIEGNNSTVAFEFMKFISSDRKKRAMRSEKLNGKASYSGFREELEAVKKLCQRPYWERLWIVQEVVVSQEAELYCGRDQISWDEFSVFQKCIEDGDMELNGDDSLEKSFAFKLDRYQVYQQTDYSNLIELLEPFSSSLCFEVRDKVYELVGLAKDAVNFPIDYSRSLYDIFVDVIQLQDKEDCALLMACSQFVQQLLKGEVAKSAYDNTGTSERLIGALGFRTGTIRMVKSAGEAGTIKMLQDFRSELLDRQINPVENNNILLERKDLIHDVETLLRSEINGLLSKRMQVASSGASYAAKGGLTYKEYKRLRISRPTGRGRDPEKSVPWGQLNRHNPGEPHLQDLPEHHAAPADLVISDSENQSLQCFIDSRGLIGVTTCDVRAFDNVCQFQASDVVAILRWQESASCYSLVGSAVFSKRRNEADTPIVVDSKETFQFSAPTSEECVEPISLWLTPYDLQRLTQ